MQRAFAVFFLLCLLAGQVSMIGALLGRHQARQQMHHRIDAAPGSSEEDVQHLTISRSDLQSSRSTLVRIDEREFRYRGNLYDIVREEWRGSVWHVWVVHDREEERYLDALAHAMGRPMLEGSPVPSHQRPLAYRPLALVPAALARLPGPRMRSKSFSSYTFTAHQAPYLEVPHPPPWG